LIRKILLSIDESQYTQKNIDYICELATLLEAGLTILHIVAMPTIIAPEAYVDPKPFLEAGKGFLKEIKSKAEDRGVKVSTHIEFAYGNPAHKVVEYAKQGNFDLIAVGARGGSRIRNILLGSVAETVARDAPCPVLIIR
jgi:nucleotide-binding universal stress UspA family protein